MATGSARGQDADVLDDPGLVLGHAVAVLGDLDQVIEEPDLVLEEAPDVECVFGHFLLDALEILVPAEFDGAVFADDEAFAAARASLVVDDDVAFGLDDGLGVAIIEAQAAIAAGLGHDAGMGDGMLVELPGAGGAAHAEVLERRGEAGLDVTGNMGQAEQGVRIQEGAADLGRFDAPMGSLAFMFVAADEAVGDDDRDIDDVRPKTVAPGQPDVVDGIRAVADIERVGIRQEGARRLFPDLMDEVRGARAAGCSRYCAFRRSGSSGRRNPPCRAVVQAEAEIDVAGLPRQRCPDLRRPRPG